MVPDRLLAYAAECYDFDASTLRFISDSTNQIYLFVKDGKDFILRFSPRPVECIPQTNAEMDWLYFLANRDVNVSLPLSTASGDLVTSMTVDGRHYILSAFARAGGVFWNKNDPDRWNERIFFNWGRVMGDIHACSKDFYPRNATDKRPEFKGDDALADSIKAMPPVDRVARSIRSEMLSLPRSRDSYGLIHYDLHPYNFLLDGERINVFDFDDSLYGFFALDIGIALYHALWWGLPETAQDRNAFIPVIIENFLKGYLQGNHLSDFWLSKIPLFMRFRQICAFSWFFDPNHMDDEQRAKINNIENGVLFADCTIDDTLFCANTH
jgi:Ser/Thr protein kinase RdoA (MazF antagonist)